MLTVILQYAALLSMYKGGTVWVYVIRVRVGTLIFILVVHLLDTCRCNWKSHQGVDCGSLLASDIFALDLNRDSSESSTLAPCHESPLASRISTVPFLSGVFTVVKVGFFSLLSRTKTCIFKKEFVNQV